MKPQNNRRPKTISLSEQQRAIVVETVCALIDSLIDLLIAVDPYPPLGIPSISWELPAASRPRQRDGRTDDNLDVSRCLAGQQPSLSEPSALSRWAYPSQAVWDKHIRTNRN